MSQALSKDSAFRWAGTLKETSIRQLYERCQRLRLTGNMRLTQGAQSLDLTWIGGEPIENEGDQGTRSLPLWNDGQFVVEQRIPDWKGRLTQGVELSGSLRAGQVTSIYSLCSDNHLSADVELLNMKGERAQVRFTLGKAESALIAGQSESAISAMSKLGTWTEGTFRISLRPAFGDEKAAEAPVFKGQPGGQFDVTGAVDMAQDSSKWPTTSGGAAGSASKSNGSPPPTSGVTPSKTPPSGSAAAQVSPTLTPSKGNAIPPRLAQTLIRAPGAAGMSPFAQLPPEPEPELPPPQITSGSKSMVVVVSIAVMILSLVGIAAALLLR
jgi:hypothetical protein